MTNQSKADPASRRTLCVTSALPYANNDIHLGHIVEAVQTDLYVRYHRMAGDRVLYVCADDTHGTPIQLNALKKGVSPEELVGGVWERHVKDYAGFSIDFDMFYTTNSPENKRYAEFVYAKLRENGLVVSKEIMQYYCEHDGRFLPDRFISGECPKCGAQNQYGDVCEVCGSTYDPTDLKAPVCIICKTPPVLKPSTHVFVELAKCEQFLRDYVLGTDVIGEETRNFVRTWIDQGLREWCISRDGPYFGFPIPGLENKFFYVWLDAPIGYIAATDKWCHDHKESVETFWGKDSPAELVHFIGKDIVYFHALFWPVMLKSAGFKLPSRIFVHGFLTMGGEKMSKSRGTFIMARDYLAGMTHPLAAQYLRFFFGAKLSDHVTDLDLNPEEFCNRVNTTLVNNIGNFHHRTFVFCDRNFSSSVPDEPWDETIAEAARKTAEEIAADFDTVEFKSAIERIHALGNLGNKYYQDSKPWELIKTKPQDAAKVMVTCVNLVKALAVFLKPIVPGIVKSLEEQLGMTLSWSDHVFSMRNCKLGTTQKIVTPLERGDLEKLIGGASVSQPASSKETASGKIPYADFAKVDLRVATILEASKVEKSQKLVKLKVQIGAETRQIVAGIAQFYTPESLVGKQVVVVANLEPAKLMGLTSEGMLLAAKEEGGLALVIPEKPIGSGATVS